MKTIVLCATQRSGSTLVCGDMRATGVLGMPEEYFIGWRPDQQGRDWAAELDQVLLKAATPNGVSSFKIMANQLLHVEKCLNPATNLRAPLCKAFQQAFRNAVWVWIEREDKLNQAISSAISEQTGVNHAVGSGERDYFPGNLMVGYKENYNKDAKFDFDLVHRTMMRFVNENLLWDRFFHTHHINPIRLRYNEFVENRDAYLAALAKAAGVELPAEIAPRKLMRLANKVNEEWRQRYISTQVNKTCDNYLAALERMAAK